MVIEKGSTEQCVPARSLWQKLPGGPQFCCYEDETLPLCGHGDTSRETVQFSFRATTGPTVRQPPQILATHLLRR